jgi:carotenoid cleavage dioxygenase
VHTLYRWSFNMRTGAVREGTIDDLNTEFPMVNANWRGRKTRYSFNQHLPLPVAGSVAGQCQTFDALVRYDLETGVSQRYAYGEGVFGNEAPVAPRVGSTDERDAYAVTFVTDTNDWRSSCLVFDAADITRGPVARIGIPHRVSAGFHATWIRGEDIFAL